MLLTEEEFIQGATFVESEYARELERLLEDRIKRSAHVDRVVARMLKWPENVKTETSGRTLMRVQVAVGE